MFCRVPTIGDHIANSIATNHADWRVEQIYMGRILTNDREGWVLETLESWVGDRITARGIPLSSREDRRIWRAIARMDERLCAEQRENAMRRYFANASGMEARQGGNEVPSRSDDSPARDSGDAQPSDPNP